jgi:hypothetical protein
VTRKLSGALYGVRTLVRLVATGQPKVRDRYFDPESTLLEDRVVLIRASSFESAIQQAENEVREYCRKTRFTNIYGQRVRLKYLGAVDAFWLFDDEPSPGCEVYSSTVIVPRSISDSKLVNERFGKRTRQRARSRYKFVDAEILTEALDLAQRGRRHSGVPGRAKKV